MQPHNLNDDVDEFDLQRWLAQRPGPLSCDCVRVAANSLAFGRGDIRSRLFDALVTVGFGDGSDIPNDLRAQFEAIRQEAQLRAGPGIDYDRLCRSVRRINVKTAKRIARRVVALDRDLTARGYLTGR
jgi:hypothetical protein